MQHQCQEKGGYLVEINDEEEYKFLKSYLTGLTAHFHDFHYYLGITSKGHPGEWTYMASGSEVTFFKWAGGQPGPQSNRDCVAWKLPHKNKNWYTLKCENSAVMGDFKAICEVDL